MADNRWSKIEIKIIVNIDIMCVDLMCVVVRLCLIVIFSHNQISN